MKKSNHNRKIIKRSKDDMLKYFAFKLKILTCLASGIPSGTMDVLDLYNT